MKKANKYKQTVWDLKPYVPTPHPMQYRIDEFRSIPSLVTGRREK
jgi:hypothetical protein